MLHVPSSYSLQYNSSVYSIEVDICATRWCASALPSLLFCVVYGVVSAQGLGDEVNIPSTACGGYKGTLCLGDLMGHAQTASRVVVSGLLAECAPASRQTAAAEPHHGFTR